MNSKQRKKDARYRARLAGEFLSYMEEILNNLESGETTIERERANVDELKQCLEKVK